MISDPRRLLDAGADDFERSLLASAGIDHGSGAAQQRCLGALAAALAVATTATAATAASSAGAVAGLGAAGAAGPSVSLGGSVSVASLGKWLGLGLVAGLFAAGTTERVASLVVGPPPAAVLAPRPTPPAVTAPALSPVPRAPAASAAAAPEHPPAALAGSAPAVAVPRASGSSSLAAELRWLDAARGALARGDAGAALAALDERERRHPDGALGPEATLLRVQAHLSRGDRASARRVAAPWLEPSVRGAHAERIRALVAEEAAPPIP